ncbi:MAG TPA: hypothetical protein VGG04_16560 [Candidatus Sulfotelmatobacter sp.]|jgi:hypothetical protein
MHRHLTFALILGSALGLTGFAQNSDSHNSPVDIQVNNNSLHVGDDADAKKIGLPLYPGAKLKTDDKENNNQANLSLFTEAFGMKLLVANYVSSDSSDKVLDFYRGKMRKYGKVIECHTDKHGGDVDVHEGADKDSKDDGKGKNQELKCDSENNSGPVTELKAGTEDDQHIVAVEPGSAAAGVNFALVYVHTRGKRGEI